MNIRYGHITGWCVRCGCVDFDYLSPAPESLRCAACGASASYCEITGQIGDEAVRQMQSALRTLRRRYKAHRERVAELRDALPGVRTLERPAAAQRQQQVVERDDAGDVAAQIDHRKRIAA